MNKVLLVVDMQNGFLNYECYRSLNKKIDNYIKKNDYELIIFTKFINTNDSLYEKKLNWFNLKTKQSQEICVYVPKNSIIFEKYGYGLQIEDLEKIKELGIEDIDICGLQTDACVYAIAFQLWDNGIYPNILINYTATAPEREEGAKKILLHQFGKVDERL